MTSPPPQANGNGNGHHAHGPGLYAEDGDTPSASTSASGFAPPANGYGPSPIHMHNEDIIKHLYEAGFQAGLYADTTVHVLQYTYGLHAIILSRSPYLAHLMAMTPPNQPQRVIVVPVEHEPEITQEGFAIALGYLYSSMSLNLIRPENARAVLAAGCLLGGMEELCAYAYEAARRAIAVDTIDDWLRFLDALPAGGAALGSAPSSGMSTPVSPVPPAPPSVFGLYAQRLRDDVFHFLVAGLPATLGVAGAGAGAADATAVAAGRETLLQVFSRVPFDIFKAAMESPAFEIGSEQTRFKFARDAIELRKKGIGRGAGAEETVVLAFGGGNTGGSAVHVTRKIRRRPLWKVGA